MQHSLTVPPFLSLDSEMGKLMREHDWSGCSIGGPSEWSQNLQSKLNTIMCSAFPMFLFWGEDLVCFYNDAFRPSLGVEGKHPAIGKKGKEVWVEIWDFIGPLIERVMTTGKPVWFEDQYVPFYRNGRIEDIYWTFSYSPVTNETNEICGVVVVCTETTEKVNLLKRLEESHKLYSFAIEASELGTWDLDPQTNRFHANDRLKEWFGLENADPVDLDLALAAIESYDRNKVTDAIQRALKGEGAGNLDIEYAVTNNKTGETRVVRAKGKVTFDEARQPVRFNGTLQDITAEVAAREQSQKLSVLVENSVDLMAILKLDGKNSYINKAGKKLLGIDEDADVTQIPITSFHTAEQFAFVESEIIPSVMSKGRWSGAFAIRNVATGEIIPLYNNSHRIDNDRTGEPIAVGTVMRDLRAELDARHNLERQVAERTKELLKLNDELQRKNKELQSFAFVSSHDLQEPLRKIGTFISRIEYENPEALTGKSGDYFTRIKKSAVRMQTLINDLLNFSQTSSSTEQLQETDLNIALADVLKELEDKIETNKTSIKIEALPTVKAIPFQVHQLFVNLLNNAIKFSLKEEASKIAIQYELVKQTAEPFNKEINYHQITFSDNGMGFDPAYSDKIFEVFQRLHSKDDFEGTGIGLSICKKIMDNHNGFIMADAVPGKGAVFTLYFPAL